MMNEPEKRNGIYSERFNSKYPPRPSMPPDLGSELDPWYDASRDAFCFHSGKYNGVLRREWWRRGTYESFTGHFLNDNEHRIKFAAGPPHPFHRSQSKPGGRRLVDRAATPAGSDGIYQHKKDRMDEWKFIKLQRWSQGDRVMWILTDEVIPKGSVGVVKGPESRPGWVKIVFNGKEVPLPTYQLRPADAVRHESGRCRWCKTSL